MPTTALARRPSAGQRRAGYLAAIAVNTALLVILNGWPGWQAIPFLTSETSQVLALVNVSLAVGLAVNAVYLAADPPWLKSLGDLIIAGIGLAVVIRLWQVFPFEFHPAGWATVVRVLLGLAIAGFCIGIVVQAVSLLREAARHATHGGGAHIR